MAQQLSLFGSPEPEETPAEPARAAEQVKLEPAPEPIVAYASVVLDIPTRALSEPFAYGIPSPLPMKKPRSAPRSWSILAIARPPATSSTSPPSWATYKGNNALDSARIKPIEAILSKPLFTAEAARIARWMSREYVATLSECLRLFLPPGGSPRVVKGDDGVWTVERPAVKPIQNRWVMLTPEGFDYTPPKTAVRQRQLIEALQCGPVTTRDLNLLYNSMSATIKALEKRGVVVVEERRAWRGCSEQTTLSSASGKAPVALTNGQQQALAQIERARLDAHGDVVLVDGVTGSGKTEVYLSAIERVLAAGRSACVLVPEISLTAQTVGRFRSRFGETVAVFHSRLSAGERLDQWDMVASSAARVVVGARSALFCPLSNLGLIIIDEEHETSYKQGSSPRYHAREVAAEMARRYRCPLVLGSATPSAEALDRCCRGAYNGATWTRVEMPERPGHAVLPTVRIADLRREFSHGSRSMFSKPLMEGLERVVERREKGRAAAQPPRFCAVPHVPRVRLRAHLQPLLHRAHVPRAHAHAAVPHLRVVLACAALPGAHEPLSQMWQPLLGKKWVWVRSRSRTRCTRCCPRTSPSSAWMPIPRVARTHIKSCLSSSMPPIAPCCWAPR